MERAHENVRVHAWRGGGSWSRPGCDCGECETSRVLVHRGGSSSADLARVDVAV